MRLNVERHWLSVELVVLVALVAASCTTVAGVADDVTGARDLAVVAPEAVGVSSTRLERLDAGMRQFVDDGRLAGVVTMMARHGKTVHFSNAGLKDIESDEPITEDSIFLIYSMSKPITGVAMMMLYEEGKWRLNDPGHKVHPGVRQPTGSRRRRPERRTTPGRRHALHDDARADDPFLGTGVWTRRLERGRPEVSRDTGARFQQAPAGDDRHAGDAAAAVSAGRALVLQHRG